MKKINFKSFLALLTFLVIISFGFKVDATDSVGKKLIKNIDLNYDGKIDSKDTALIVSHYNTKSDMKNWDSSYDVNNDLVVNSNDTAFLSKYLGVTMSFGNISATVNQFDPFDLPNVYGITLSNGSRINTPIVWNKTTVNTQTVGKYTYTGILTYYKKTITLSLNVVASTQKGINHGNITNYGITAKQGDWIYYLNTANKGALSRVKSDGSSVKKLCDDMPYYINVLNGWIYYSNASDKFHIYKIRTDGTGRTKLNNDTSEYINVVGDWIYYQNDSDDYKLYKIKLDGSKRTKLNNERSVFVNVVGDWIYYGDYSHYGEICKIKTDGTGKKALNDETSSNIIVDGDWIYYISETEQNKIYRIRLDGSNKKEITTFNVENFHVSGDWIYFPSDTSNYSICRQKTDGTNLVHIDMDSSIDFLNIIDDNAYYIDKKSYAMFKAKIDGSQKSLFGQDTVISKIDNTNSFATQGDLYEFPPSAIATMSDGSKQYVPVSWWNTTSVDTSKVGASYKFQGTVEGYDNAVSLTINVIERGNSNGNCTNNAEVSQKDGWIYFKNNSDGGLYKIKPDDSGKEKLTADNASNINVIGNWIYYTAGINIYKIKTDGTSETQINKTKTYSYNILGEWLFYPNCDDNNSLYKIKTDGTSVTKLNNQNCSNINIANDWIFYIDQADNSIYKMRLDGSYKTRIINYASKMVVYNGYIYYIGSSDYKIYRVKTNGTDNKKICDDGTSSINVSDGYIYYNNYSDLDKLYKIKIDGTQKSKIADDDVRSNISILGKVIYYDNYSDLDKIYRVTLDGKDRRIFGSKVTISSIDDIYVNIKTNSQYTLPNTVVAHMSEGLESEYPIKWDYSTVNTNKVGTYTFQGTVQGYSKKVKLVLSVTNTVKSGNTTSNIINKSFACTSGDWIYYCTNSDSGFGKINKIKKDGTGKTTIKTGVDITNINVVDDWIYYLSDFTIYKVKTDGSGLTKITDNYASSINIVGDWIYYANIYSGGIYRIKTDGTQKTKITNDMAQNVIVDNGCIYYSNGYLGRIRVDGTCKIKYELNSIWCYALEGEYIYYASTDGYVYRMKTDGTSKTQIAKTGLSTTRINVFSGWIYFIDDYKLYKMKIDGSSKTEIQTSIDSLKELNVVGDWIFFMDYSDNAYKIKTDGTHKEKIS